MKGKQLAAGGVVVDAQHRVLLREPRGHFGGYVWTFPKGRVDPGETPEQAALREVHEETGYAARIIDKVPGQFEGDTTSTVFFLMTPVGEPVEFDRAETQSIRWVPLVEAAGLIALTTSAKGRKRDLAVLEAAVNFLTKCLVLVDPPIAR